MKKLLTIVSSKDNKITTETFAVIRDYLKVVIKSKWLDNEKACEIYFDSDKNVLLDELVNYFNTHLYDWAYQNAEEKYKSVFISDMDSTIIKQECIDEIADLANVKEEVEDITRSAMQGEVAFAEALEKRVGLLKGIKLELLNKIYDKIEFNDGAEKLLINLNKQKIKTILVSGGFTFFTEKISEELNFQENYANSLEVIDGTLTGKVIPPIIDSISKKKILKNTIDSLRIKSSEVVAIGDGANDLEIIRDAGLGISYKGKQILKASANGQIEHTDLCSLLYFIGLPKDKIIT
tara:strand:+ start:973 stop:1851 length:879 start_codon:yes stop_codon:yes gene_type:complete